MIRAVALSALFLAQAPDVVLPPKRDMAPPVPTRPNADVVLDGVRRAARACGAAADAGDCVCAALKRTRFDVRLDGGTLTVSYPFNGVGGPSFTVDSDGRVVACAF